MITERTNLKVDNVLAKYFTRHQTCDYLLDIFTSNLFVSFLDILLNHFKPN